MKPKLKISAWLVCGVSLTGAVITIAAKQNKVSQLRAEKGELSKANEEIARLKAENAQLEQLRIENIEVQKLRLANKDLPKLRNQVRQLRGEVEEAQKLRSENERLAAAQQNGSSGQGVSRPLPEGFIPRANMADVGLFTPEAAVQTFFSAMRDGNIQRLEQCFVNGPPLPTDPGALQKQQQELANEFAHFPGFAITGKTEVSADEVIVHVQTAAGGSVVPVPLKRIGNEWKMSGGP